MSTNDVPGYKPENRDELAMGCWAEHDDGTLLLVENTEGGRAIYSVFDMDKDPVTEFRDSMAVGAFKKQFSYDGKAGSDKWCWHDKSQFPWDKIIKEGLRDGVRYAHVEDQLTEADKIRRKRESMNAAQRLRRSRDINEEHEVDPHELEARIERHVGKASKGIMAKVQRAIDAIKPGKAK